MSPPQLMSLIAAQTAAASGDSEAAAAALTEAQTALSELQAACLADGVDRTPPVIELPNTYTSDPELFTIDYPEGWSAKIQTVNEGAGVEFEPEDGSSDLPQGLKPLITIVSTPLAVARWTGMIDPDKLNPETFTDDIDVLAGFQELLEGGNSNVEARNMVIEPVTVADQRALNVRLSASPNPSDPTLDILVYIIEMEPGQLYGIVVGVSMEGESSKIEPLVTAMVETLKLK